MECCKTKKKEPVFDKDSWIIIGRALVSTTLVLLGYFIFSEDNYGLFVNLAIMGIAWLICSYDIVGRAFVSMFREHEPFNEDMLMTIASIGAFALRFFGPSDNEFLEAAMVVILFQVGELFEHLATEKSHRAIRDAVGLRAKVANKLVEGKTIEVDPASLMPGDVIVVKTGEILPADGTIIEGSGSLDMSSLTGEFVPVEKKMGESVNSGTILKGGSLTIRVDKTYADSTVSKIISLVEESSKSKSDADRFIDRFSRIYTPVVVGLALLVAVVPPFFLDISDGTVWSKWVYTSLCFLVISCPCAIVISVPLAYFAGIGLASKRGIIVKGASLFDKLDRLSWVATDKTGTLTYGDFKVTKTCVQNIKNAKFMEYVCAVESRSTHPIALAILSLSKNPVDPSAITGYKERAGLGTEADYDGHHLLIGNERFFLQLGIPLVGQAEVGTMVYLAVDGKCVGYLVLNDVIRAESLEMVEGLRGFHIKTCLLTGDKEDGALGVASTLGIDEHYSGLLPDEKRKILEKKIAAKDGYVAYMGDGINDAPSIALADVGVAMGGVGSDLAIESADVVIMNDDPSKLVTAIRIAKKTEHRAIFNIAIALLIKLTIMLLAVFLPGFPLLVAVLADTGLTVLLVLNSVALLHSKVQ